MACRFLRRGWKGNNRINLGEIVVTATNFRSDGRHAAAVEVFARIKNIHCKEMSRCSRFRFVGPEYQPKAFARKLIILA